MKKKYLKTVCIFLSLVLVFGITGFGANAVFARAEERQEDVIVANLYLCVSGIRLPYLFGHSWICISNESDENITVGSETLEPGRMLSAGLHSGVGMEFNREMGQFRGASVSALKKPLTAEELKNVESEILSSDWDHYNLFTHNCTNFSSAVWKAGTGESFRTAIFPFVLKAQMPSEEKIKLYI